MDLIMLIVLFLVIALALTILGVRGAAISMDIAKILIAIFVVLLILSLIFGGSFFGGGPYWHT